jgi:hypothetical protein
MILVNNDVLGTMFPINLTQIANESNKTWGIDDPKLIEGQLAFSLLTYLGGMHVDLHAPGAIIEGEVQLLQRYGLPEVVKAQGKLYELCTKYGFDHTESQTDAFAILPSDPVWHNFVSAFFGWRQTSQLKSWTLRFLKRFTPDKANYLREECLRGFATTDNDNRRFDKRNHSLNSTYCKITSLAKKYLDWLLKDFNYQNVEDEVAYYCFRPTTNAVANCCSDPRHRVARVLCYLDRLPNRSNLDLYPFEHGILDLSDRGKVVIGAVPKDVKSYRIVSPDDPINLAFQQAIVHELERCINKRGLQNNLPFRDQSIMVRLAYESVLGNAGYATIDMSRASDTVRISLVREIFPEVVVTAIDKFRPKAFHSPLFKNDNEYRTLHMAAPMGSAYTLLLQSLVFWAIDCAACHLFSIYANQEGSIPVQLGKRVTFRNKECYELVELFPYSCYAMGDDQQVPTSLAEFVIFCLEECGFHVNSDKSFFDDDAFFRESCGAEAIKGDDPVVDGFYIPRHSLAISSNVEKIQSFSDLTITNVKFWNDRDRTGEAHPCNTITALINMSKVFLQLGLSHIGMKIQKWIAECVPQMTVSQFGTPADDLWGEQDIVSRYHRQPTAYVTDGTIKRRYIDPCDHRTVITEYDRKWEHGQSDDPMHAIPMHWAVTAKQKRLTACYGEAGIHNARKCTVCRWLSKHPEEEVLFLSEMENYRYQVWLQVGPNYQDNLDKLLRVSMPTPRLDVISNPQTGMNF